MPTALISESFIANLDQLEPGKRIDTFDAEIKGFILEYRHPRKLSFYFRYRDTLRRVRQIQLGKHPALSVSDARAKAHQCKAVVKIGGDPQREAARLQPAALFGDFIREKYLPHAQATKRSWSTDACLLRNHLLPRFSAVRLNCISLAMVQAMMLEEIERNRNTQVGQVVKLLLLTGARKREVLDLRWEHIDYERQLFTVPISKSGKPRHIPLSYAAIALLQSLPRDENVPWVFYTKRTGKPPVSIFFAWDTMRRRLGIKDVRLHDLRHSYASFLVNQGRSLYEVQRLLGHADAKTTQRYAHLSPGALLAAVNVVADVVAQSYLSKSS